MIKAILSFVFCGLSMIVSSAQTGDKAYTPAKGSADRQAIVDALRSVYPQPHRGRITFEVKFLKVHGNWAWIYAEPTSTDPRDRFGETNGFLFHKESAGWKMMKLPAPVDDANDPEGLDYPTKKDVAKIKHMYPSVPSDIFPTD